MNKQQFRKLLLLTTVLSLFSFLQAQNVQKYYIRTYNKQNNQLSENIISGLLLDENKLLWIATPNGLFTFDGSAIEPYPAIIPERISSIFKDRSNQLLITCVDEKIYKVEKDTFTFYHHLSNKNIEAFSASLYSKSKLTGIKNEQLLKDSLADASAVFVSPDNTIYLRRKQIIYKVNNGIFKAVTTNFPANGRDLFVDDKYWIFNPLNGTMRCINDATLKSVQTPFNMASIEKNQWILKFGESPVLVHKNRAWVFLKNNKTGQYAWQEVADNIPEDAFIYSALYSPAINKLFLGTVASGLIVISKSQFSVYQHPVKKNTIDFYRYYLQIPQKNGKVITDYPHLYKNTPEYFRNFFKNYDISYSYHQLDSANILGNTRDFYYRLDISTLKPKKIAKQPSESLQHQSYVLYNKKVYIFNNKGIFIYDRENDSIYLKLKMRIGYDLINQSTVINNKIFLSYCGGILVYDPIKNKVINRILKPTCFRFFFRYKSQIIVTSYGEGLHLIDTVNYTVKPLKPDYFQVLKRTHFLFKDYNNFIWASTNDGLLRISQISFDRVLAGGEFLPQPQYFDSKNGLPNDEMNGGAYPAYINFADTLLSAPSLMGIIQFHPLRDFPFRTAGLGIRIKKISCLGKTLIPKNNVLTIGSEMNEVKFQIQTAHWDNPKNLNLYYRLNNHLYYIPYTELNSLNIFFEKYGEHSLEFLYLDDFGKETITFKTTIIKEKPWYLKWSYIIGFIIFIIGIIIVISSIRTRNIEKKNIELQKIINEKTLEIREINESLVEKVAELTQLDKINNIYISVINHDIFAPIKYINMVGDKVYDFQNKLKKADIIMYMELIINSTKRLEILCSNILNERSSGSSFSRITENISMHQLLTDLKNFIKIGIQINQNKLIIDVPETAVACTSFNALNIILTNIVSNANRFTKQGKITVSYRKTNEGNCITVTDTGNGMPADVLEKIRNRTLEVNNKDGTEFQSYGIGYSLIFKMIDVIDGKMTIDSEPLKGTSVSITFPDKALEQA